MEFFIIFLSLLLLELLYFKVANKYNIIDKPNERSSHNRITIRGGGIIFYFSILAFFILSGFSYPYFFLGLSLITAISFVDDIKPISSKLRLLFHFTAMGLLFYQWGLFDMPWWWLIIALIVCTGIINAYNFMDGINGITGGYSLVVLCSLAYVNKFMIPFVEANIIYFLIIAVIVFNFFNFRVKAKCFSGDVGSVSMAFIIIFLIGTLIIKTENLSWITLLLLYGVDTVLTIVHRILLKEKITDAHRKHLYQIMANELRIPHLLVSTTYMLIQLAVTIGFLYAYKQNLSYQYFIILSLVLGVFYIIFMKKYFHLHQEKAKS